MTDSVFFATTPKAMEDILVTELKQLGAQNVKPALAGAYFDGSIETSTCQGGFYILSTELF